MFKWINSQKLEARLVSWFTFYRWRNQEDKCFAPCLTISPAKSEAQLLSVWLKSWPTYPLCPTCFLLRIVSTFLSYYFQSWLKVYPVYLNSPKYWISIYSSILSTFSYKGEFLNVLWVTLMNLLLLSSVQLMAFIWKAEPHIQFSCVSSIFRECWLNLG